MDGLDHGKQPARAADRPAQPRVFDPREERQQRHCGRSPRQRSYGIAHLATARLISTACSACWSGAEVGYRESVRQPAARVIIARCGLSQSNQLYAIIRPAMTMPAHTTKDRPAATLALLGGTGCKSHSANLRYTVAWKTHTFKPADISSNILSRKKIF